MHKPFLITAAILGALSVILGAFAAHGLKQFVSTDAIGIFDTGIRYQFYHVFGLLAIGILYKEFPVKLLQWSGYFFCAGILFFCGSLYLLAWNNGQFQPGFKWLYLITPLGGLLFITGWLLLVLALLKKN